MKPIFHQIYWNFSNPGHSMPPEWQKLREKCLQTYPTWQHKLWGLEEANKFISTSFPWLLPTWQKASNIEKVDILRYAIMFLEGGIYLDLDTECLREWIPPRSRDPGPFGTK